MLGQQPGSTGFTGAHEERPGSAGPPSCRRVWTEERELHWVERESPEIVEQRNAMVKSGFCPELSGGSDR